MKKRNFWNRFARGTSLGLGMVPGISAGTMAVVVDIFDESVSSIASITKNTKKSFSVLLPILLGAIVSSILFLIGVKYGYQLAPFAFTCLFAGFVTGTLPLIYKEIKGQPITIGGSAVIIAAFLFTSLIGILSALSKIYWGVDLEAEFETPPWWFYFVVAVAGFIAAAACIVPGISGSLILYIFGLYTPIVELYVGSTSIFHNSQRIGSGIGLTVSLLIGALLGFFLISKAMNSLLKNHHLVTFQAVFGFVIGSIFAMFINQNSILKDKTWIYEKIGTAEWIIGPILFVAFSILFFLLSKLVIKKQSLTK